MTNVKGKNVIREHEITGSECNGKQEDTTERFRSSLLSLPTVAKSRDFPTHADHDPK